MSYTSASNASVDAAVFAYTSYEMPGLKAIVTAGGVSTVVVFSFLSYITGRWIFRRLSKERTTDDIQMSAYLYCLFVADLLQAISVVMSAKWIALGASVASPLCTTQAVLKMAGGVGGVVWTTIIAAHVFNLLFLQLKPIGKGLFAVLVAVWGLLVSDVLLGPTIHQMAGDFFGPSPSDGPWCWITEKYATTRVFVEYLPMMIASTITFVLLALVLLRLRGNIYMTGSRMKIRWINSDDAWHIKMLRDEVDNRILLIVKRMIGFPICYFVFNFPALVIRLMMMMGMSPPWGFTAFAAILFSLSGTVNVLLYCFIQRVMPHSIVIPVYADLEKHKQPPAAPIVRRRVSSFSYDQRPITTPSVALAFDSQDTKGDYPSISVTSPKFAPASPTQPTARRFSAFRFPKLAYDVESSPRAVREPYATNFLSFNDTMIDPAASAISEYQPSVVSATSTGLDIVEPPPPPVRVGKMVQGGGQISPDGRYKAKLYGARFSLVAGPVPAYNYDRTRNGVENRALEG